MSDFPAKVCFNCLFMDDGSEDITWAARQVFRQRHPDRLTQVKAAGNTGSYNAIVSGVAAAAGNCLAVITADRRDTVGVADDIYSHWQQGFKPVLVNQSDLEKSFSHWDVFDMLRWPMRYTALAVSLTRGQQGTI